KALCCLHYELIARGMAERVVDELESIDVEQHDRDALASARAHFAQRAIELIHEVAAIRQPRESVVIAGVLEALLQIFALFDLGNELAIGKLQLPPRERKRVARAVQAVHEIVSRKREQPRDDGEQRDRRG